MPGDEPVRQDEAVISIENARALSDAGVLWRPEPGDRFTIDEPELLGELFWISDFTIEVHAYQDEVILGFNGTTEWALDSVPIDLALWLPREDQLRDLIGDRLQRVTRDDSGWEVVVEEGEHRRTVEHDDIENAYAEALLAVIDR
jgi:hypothetical protein